MEQTSRIDGMRTPPQRFRMSTLLLARSLDQNTRNPVGRLDIYGVQAYFAGWRRMY